MCAQIWPTPSCAHVRLLGWHGLACAHVHLPPPVRTRACWYGRGWTSARMHPPPPVHMCVHCDGLDWDEVIWTGPLLFPEQLSRFFSLQVQLLNHGVMPTLRKSIITPKMCSLN